MASRRIHVFLLAGALFSMGASFRTTNFLVDAPTPQLAQQVGQYAEHYRKEKAQLWLGQEMAPWPEPCPLKVKIAMSGAGGATSFAFDRGRVLGQNMTIEGSIDRLLASVLPHEVTHTVFAQYFRCPVPRWADEGGAVLSEDEVERNRHDMLVRQILNSPGRAMPLRRLFSLRDYPGDVMVLYAEGYSVSQFLVDAGGRQTFLAFVAQGMNEGWDHAVRASYRYNSVEELEQAWLAHLRATRRPPVQFAQNTAPVSVDPVNRVVIRRTVPPAPPVLSAPVAVFRGQTPVPGQETERFGDPENAPVADPLAYLPGPPAHQGAYPVQQPIPVPSAPWQPAGTLNYQHPDVRLGMPQAILAPSPGLAPPQ